MSRHFCHIKNLRFMEKTRSETNSKFTVILMPLMYNYGQPKCCPKFVFLALLTSGIISKPLKLIKLLVRWLFDTYMVFRGKGRVLRNHL